MKIASQIISWVFLPLFMPIYGLLVVMYLPSLENDFFQANTFYWLDPNVKITIISLFMIFSVVAPSFSLLMLKRRNKISNIEIDNREERGVPITITAIYSVILAVFLLVKAPNGILPKATYALPWGGMIGIVLAGLINRYEKISLHGMGAGMLFGFFVAYYQNQNDYFFLPIVLSVLIGGLVMSARVYLGKHTLRQVLTGYLLGFLVIYLMITLFPDLR
jgi:membrane-associated phospholipid phosphatase